MVDRLYKTNTLQVAEDVYESLLRQKQRPGDTLDNVLRRLLRPRFRWQRLEAEAAAQRQDGELDEAHELYRRALAAIPKRHRAGWTRLALIVAELDRHVVDL